MIKRRRKPRASSTSTPSQVSRPGVPVKKRTTSRAMQSEPYQNSEIRRRPSSSLPTRHPKGERRSRTVQSSVQKKRQMSQPTSLRRQKSPRRRLRRRFVLSVFVLALLILLCYALPQFRVYKVEISDQLYLPKAVLEKEARLPLGFHIFSLSNGSWKDRILGRLKREETALAANLSSLTDVSIRFRFPSTLWISGKHNGHFYYFQTPQQVLVIDDSGYIFGVGDSPSTALADAASVVPSLNDGVVILPQWRYLGYSKTMAPNESLSLQYQRYERLPLTWIQGMEAWHQLKAQLELVDQKTPSDWAYAPQVDAFEVDDRSFFFNLNLQGLADMSDEAAAAIHQVTIRISKVSAQAQIRWLKNALKMGYLNNLGEGVLDLSHPQYIFVPKAQWVVDPFGQTEGKRGSSTTGPQTSESSVSEVPSTASQMSESIPQMPPENTQSRNISTTSTKPQLDDSIEFATRQTPSP